MSRTSYYDRELNVSVGALIVGASLSGLRLAECLRSAGYTGPITVAGAERWMPYNRPPLSKDVLVGGSDEDATSDADFAKLALARKPSVTDVTWHLGVPAIAADLDRRTVTLADGRSLSYDVLGVATGLTPRRLPFKGGEGARHVIRTLDDAERLRRALRPGTRVVVAGGGFIGCETAASAVKRGAHVTVVESLPVPMGRAIGDQLGTAIRAYHERRGVTFVCGTGIAALACASGDASKLEGVYLSDGRTLPADILIEAVGSTCNTSWLEGNGLDLTDGVLTGNDMTVPGQPGVAAAGDIARFPNPRYGPVARRVEHWAIPGLTARRAATSLAALLDGREPDTRSFDPVPTFWSDQFDMRIQSAGMPSLADRSEVLEGSLDHAGERTDQGLAMGYWRDGTMIGAVAIGLPVARFNHYRQMLG